LIFVLTPGFEPVFTHLSTASYAPIIGYILLIVAGYILTAQFAKVGYIKLFHS
jgi:hypothetical protein